MRGCDNRQEDLLAQCFNSNVKNRDPRRIEEFLYTFTSIYSEYYLHDVFAKIQLSFQFNTLYTQETLKLLVNSIMRYKEVINHDIVIDLGKYSY